MSKYTISFVQNCNLTSKQSQSKILYVLGIKGIQYVTCSVFVCQACDRDVQCGVGLCCAVSLWLRGLRMCTPQGLEGDECHPYSHKVYRYTHTHTVQSHERPLRKIKAVIRLAGSRERKVNSCKKRKRKMETRRNREKEQNRDRTDNRWSNNSKLKRNTRIQECNLFLNI